jgi:hypothetical protein
MVWSGCSLRTPLQTQLVGDVGRFQFQNSDDHIRGIVIGVPQGNAELAAVDYARNIQNQTGAGLVIAYGFYSKRIAVSQPLVRTVSLPSGFDNPKRRGSIYPEFKALLRKVARGRLAFYVGVRIAAQESHLQRIEVATTGFTFEQLRALEESFVRIRDRAVIGAEVPLLDVALDPLEKIFWSVSGIKQHGVLMLAERGLNLRLPPSLSSLAAKRVYEQVLSAWVGEAVNTIRRNPARLPESQVMMLNYGKIESIPAKQAPGVVVGAPHGTFDAYTSWMVRQICARTGLAGVIATGFTPTETGGGWRINVNRPSESYYPTGNYETETARALNVYQQFKRSVTKAANGNLRLYIDVHQNDGNRIEVATLGITKEEAKLIKKTYRALRDQALRGYPEMAVVELAIEPLDELEVGAWATKSSGILQVANKSLHFELPADGVMGSSHHREIYSSILAELMSKTAERFIGMN